MSEDRALEEKLLHLDEHLTRVAMEKFVEGELSPQALTEFYHALRDFSQAAEKVLNVMHKTRLDR